jgi:hypothetical protein
MFADPSDAPLDGFPRVGLRDALEDVEEVFEHRFEVFE